MHAQRVEPSCGHQPRGEKKERILGQGNTGAALAAPSSVLEPFLLYKKEESFRIAQQTELKLSHSGEKFMRGKAVTPTTRFCNQSTRFFWDRGGEVLRGRSSADEAQH